MAEDRPAEAWSEPLKPRYLIDTHVLHWLLHEPEQIDADVRTQLADPRASLRVSLASIWEIAIKIGIDKLDLGVPIIRLPQAIAEIGVEVLGISVSHVLAVAALPRHLATRSTG